MGGHESVIRVLVENGADISSGNIGQFACFAVEQNNLGLLKELVRYGGDVTILNNTGTTAIHMAICQEKVEILKFLIEGVDLDKPDQHGLTPRALADYQGNEEIKDLFRTKKEVTSKSVPKGVPCMKKYQSEPPRRSEPIPDYTTSMSFENGASSNSCSLRPRTNNFDHSLFGIMSAARKTNKGEHCYPLLSSLHISLLFSMDRGTQLS